MYHNRFSIKMSPSQLSTKSSWEYVHQAEECYTNSSLKISIWGVFSSLPPSVWLAPLIGWCLIQAIGRADMTPTRTQPPSWKRWLHFCESGSDIHEAPALASATEAVFTRILPQQGSDCIWSAGRGHSGFVRQAFLSLVMTPRCYCWANGASLPEKDLKRTTAAVVLIWTIFVFLPSTKPWLWGVGQLKEGHSEVKGKAPRNSLLSCAFKANWFWWLLEIYTFPSNTERPR